MSELICVAERLDHSVRTGFALDIDRLWKDVELTADIEHVRTLLEAIKATKQSNHKAA